MNCFERERLSQYANHLLTDQEAEQVAEHLSECPQCRGVVAEYQRLSTLLEEWKPAEPSPWFDARVCQAIESEKSHGGVARGLWGLGWTRGLALAGLAILIVSGIAWVRSRQHSVPKLSPLASKPANPVKVDDTPREVAKANPTKAAPPGARRATKPATVVAAPAAPSIEDNGTAVDDYDLVANFEILSELRKEANQVAD